MQGGSSKGSLPKQTSGSAPSKGKLNTSSKIDASASRTKNTSGGDSAATAGGRMLIYCDGKNVTPKSLVPSHYQKMMGADGQGQDNATSAIAENMPAAAGKDDADRPLEERVTVQVPERSAIGKGMKSATLSAEELERKIDIVLGETETETLLVFPSLCVALDNPLSGAISARNKAYEELCASKADSDQYKEQHAQTLNQPDKHKEVFAASPSQEHVEVNANGWDIYDTFAKAPVPKHEQIQQACEKESQDAVSLAVKKPGCLFTMMEPYPSTELGSQGKKTQGDGKRTAKGASGVVRSGISAGPSSVAAGGSKALGSGPTNDSVGGTQSGAPAGSPVGESAGASGTQATAAPAPAGDGSQSPTQAGQEPGQDKEGAEAAAATDEEKEEGDKIPWKEGAENPIPEEMAKSLRVMERIVSQNVFHRQHMIYRNYPTLEELARLDEIRMEEAMGITGGGASVPDTSLSGLGAEASQVTGGSSTQQVGAGLVEDEDAPKEGEGGEDELAGEASCDDGDSDKPSLQDLFCFDAPQLTQGMTVTCAEWNRHNQDLLAVSYGDTAPVPSAPGGLVLFWSLKNPTYPERVIRTRHGVTTLHFSAVHPNMVAAGGHDGSVMIWDLRRPSDAPVLRSGSSVSTHNDQKHTDIVWETRWVDQGPDKQELLVSVSSDGNVLQWSLKKGLEQSLLMQMKRLPNPHLGSNSVYGHKEGIVFRKSSGFCVDFPRHDSQTYLVGTEDGLVHRCSTSYNEQYLDTYYGHSGPVYRVRCNPFMSHAFLTCSADWTMKLWTTKPLTGHQPDAPLLTFQSTDLFASVNDVIWAPHNSTSFAAAMDDGRIELWDLAEKPLDPIVVHYPQANQPQRRRTCVRFSPNSPVLVAGDDQGSVDVMRMYNTNQSYYSDQEQQDRLSAVMFKKR
eukprot:TRINITY_DN18575_c0_g1_i1.p1 TRINITY_DN18575_c0_g1~~TRINITY_DN18575_c0_g1_i1.p1  ORF type:complete len:908 (-),score=146.67 TRINITY_DN18575_c0_g1_i1:401-3124(-)